MKTEYSVVSHTHWDREWYQSHELFRLRLVDMMDRLFDIFETYPAYVFHLDAQTIVLEDYLEIRPQNREKLTGYIRRGNLVVGPWYLQNDFYLTSGEATVRNLLEGARLCRAFGGGSGVGYAPDQFGNISQLPQLLRGFGMDNFVFGRGFRRFRQKSDGGWEQEGAPAEFVWEGPDGSRLLAIHLRHWYNNAQRFSPDPARARRLLELERGRFKDAAATPYLLLMNGVDHLEAQDDLLPVLEDLQRRLGDDAGVSQVRLEDYIRRVQAYVGENRVPLETHHGELRMGTDYELLRGTLSSRIYLKKENVWAQDMLEKRLEPLYTMLEMGGARGSCPADFLRYLWRLLMQNHAHDSICGCGRDEVHRHMEDRFARFRELAEELLRRALETAARHSSQARDEGGDYILLLANTLGGPCAGAVEAELLFPLADGVNGFDIVDAEGRGVPFVLLTREIRELDVLSPLNLPGRVPVEACRIVLEARELPPMSVRALRVRPVPVRPETARPEDARPVLENAYLRVEADESGRVNLTCKRTGRRFENCLYMEDTADRGDAYVHQPGEEAPVVSGQFPAAVRVLEKNACRQRLRLEWVMELPAAYDFEGRCRSADRVAVPVRLELGLDAGDETLKIRYDVENRAQDHRLRLVAGGYASAVRCFADTPFDVVERRREPAAETKSNTYPNTSFAVLEDEKAGLALFTAGEQEFEWLPGGLAVTLLRSTGVINRNPVTLLEEGGAQWRAPENQCLRRLDGRLGLTLYEGGFRQAGIPLLADRFRIPLLAHFAPQDGRKFTGGRTAVQETALEELFYLPDAYPGLRLADDEPAVRIQGDALRVSALKRAEDGRGFILRFWSYTAQPQEAVVEFPGTVYRANPAETEEALCAASGRLRLTVQPFEIVTLRLLSPCRES